MSNLCDERVQILNSHATRENGQYVLYAMRSAQRVEDNPALALAAERANRLGQPLVVTFCLTWDFPEANLRHFTFMLEGLAETFPALHQLGAHTALLSGRWAQEVERLGRRASEVVLDRGYLRLHRTDVEELRATLECRLFQVEGEAVVPVEVASHKSEYAARTLRPRVLRHLDRFLHRAVQRELEHRQPPPQLQSLEAGLTDLAEFLRPRKFGQTVAPVSKHFQGGPSAARHRLERFLKEKLPSYQDQRNQPQFDLTSGLSPYLHYGMLSPVQLALSVQEASQVQDLQSEQYLEELVVRRGLSQNFCHFTPDYDSWHGLPAWAKTTLEAHAVDSRPTLYTLDQLERAATHDRYWNAAQIEMVETGFMHNTMRMYWGKKILEWSTSPQQAYQNTLTLNNRYFLDGRDPVSFANVGWIFGLHDRPWKERAIYGTVRCMMASGLERKNDPKAYVRKVEQATGRLTLSPEAGSGYI